MSKRTTVAVWTLADGREFMVETTIDYLAIDADIVPAAIRNKGHKASRAGGAVVVKVFPKSPSESER